VTAAQLLVLARAEKRLVSHIAHHGIDDAALRLCERYEAEFAAADPTTHESVLDATFRELVAAGFGEVA